MAKVEMTIAKIDTPDDKPLGERIKFKLEFALMMLMAGRTDEAATMFDQTFELIAQVDQ